MAILEPAAVPDAVTVWCLAETVRPVAELARRVAELARPVAEAARSVAEAAPDAADPVFVGGRLRNSRSCRTSFFSIKLADVGGACVAVAGVGGEKLDETPGGRFTCER